MNLTIKLEDILKKHSSISTNEQENVICAMKEACEKTLELVVENVRVILYDPDGNGTHAKIPSQDGYFAMVNKATILNTIYDIK